MTIENQPGQGKETSGVVKAYDEYVRSGDVRPFFEAYHKEFFVEGRQGFERFIGRLIQPLATWVSVTGYTIEERIRKNG